MDAPLIQLVGHWVKLSPAERVEFEELFSIASQSLGYETIFKAPKIEGEKKGQK